MHQTPSCTTLPCVCHSFSSSCVFFWLISDWQSTSSLTMMTTMMKKNRNQMFILIHWGPHRLLINQRKERRKCNTWRSEGSSSSYRKLYAFLNLLCHQTSSIICPGPRFPQITLFKLYNAVALCKRGDRKNVKPPRWLGRDCNFSVCIRILSSITAWKMGSERS
jgi:hypothetical protein